MAAPAPSPAPGGIPAMIPPQQPTTPPQNGAAKPADGGLENILQQEDSGQGDSAEDITTPAQ
jgi:hypothetical protein